MHIDFSETYFTLLIQRKNGFLLSIFCSAEDKEDKDLLVISEWKHGSLLLSATVKCIKPDLFIHKIFIKY